LDRFDRQTSMQFLKRGFKEANAQIKEVVQKGVDTFDGIVGWLAFLEVACLKVEI